MRRLVVALTILLTLGTLPAASGFAADSTQTADASAQNLQADFNNDGFADLAVGVPGETVGTVAGAGAINVLYGSATKLTGSGSQFFSQDSPGVGSTAEDGDFFGGALAAGDFNNDGFADLAVGASGEAVGTLAGAGAINVLYGSATGLTGSGSQLFHQDSTGVGSTAEKEDFFGDALTAGDFNNDGFADLAVGVPGEAVGTLDGAGAINVLYGSAAKLTGSGSQLFHQDSTGIGSTAEAFDSFGFALSAGDFNNDGFADLGVGVPGEVVGTVDSAGAINVLYGSAAKLTGSGSQFFHQNSTGIGSTAEAFDSFGFALSAGDFNNDGFADLAVGVPFEVVGTVDSAGAINVLYGRAAKLTGSGSQLFHQDSTGIGSTAEAGDLFGFALAASGPISPAAAQAPVGQPAAPFSDLSRGRLVGH